ncbi:hypothetical protein FD975_10280 [Polynucleobacter sp. AP-Jannik-300A-C4]|uniref:hypothetical protein n=1 Tax=Polynucleobacter sp. AP-Jannik-300A-C4 TaxID=2576928 RepID=UPI001BFDE50D|nr:hypothetical protein [Polynucleobacter sp. AP-Jannik-300A-C4]QWE22627.1 hypothetical protein FD975_10280 [Polynucleobacter sp. AP-Jannik-300A-C4]
MDTFNIITGVVSLLSFAIQMFDLFPSLGKNRQTFSILVLGLFFGGLATSFSSHQIQVKFEVTGLSLVLTAIGVVIFGALIASAFSSNQSKISGYYAIAGWATPIFLLVLLFGTLITSAPDSLNKEKQRLSINELDILATNALKVGDEEKSISYLESIKARLSSNDERRKLLDEKIKEIKSQSRFAKTK